MDSVENGESNSSTSEKSRKRAPATRATLTQLSVLKNVFCQSPSPSSQVFKTMAEETGLPLKWISQWFSRQRTKGRKINDSANPRSRTGSTVPDSVAPTISPYLAPPEPSLSESNLSTLSTAEILQVKTEQQDGQAFFLKSGLIMDACTTRGPSNADLFDRQSGGTGAFDNTRDVEPSSKIVYASENAIARGAYTPPLLTDSPISRRGISSTVIAPQKRPLFAVQSSPISALLPSSIGSEAVLVPLEDARLSLGDFKFSEESLAISAAQKAAHAIRSAYSSDKAALDSLLLQTTLTLVESKGTQIRSRPRVCHAPASCSQPLAPVQSIEVRSNLAPQANALNSGLAIDPNALDFPGISKPVDLEAVDPSRAPLKHLTHILEGYKAPEDGSYLGLLVAGAVPVDRKRLIDCLTDSGLVSFEAAMGLSLLSRLGLL